MLFLLPIRTSIRPWRRPLMNYALIIANFVVFALSYYPHTNKYTGAPEALRQWADHFMLYPLAPQIWQFVSYGFLHAGFAHILGNMFFLYLFGNNVNDKLGHIGYLCFYLAGVVFSGIGHTLLSTNPILGASGAVAAVTGAYLVLFPRTLVTVFWWIFIFIDTVEIPALYFIGFKLIVWDNMIERSISHVAYNAHLSGYAFGILAIIGMLATGILSGSHFDMWSMIVQWNRRRRFREVVSEGYDPFSPAGGVKKIRVKEIKKSRAELDRQQKCSELRSDINRWLAQRNTPAAANVYLRLMEIDTNQVLPSQQLLDIANQLASEGKHEDAAAGYEQFISHYSNYEYIEQVQLMLGLLYCRYLKNGEGAKKYLELAAERLRDPGQVQMCKEELERLEDD